MFIFLCTSHASNRFYFIFFNAMVCKWNMFVPILVLLILFWYLYFTRFFLFIAHVGLVALRFSFHQYFAVSYILNFERRVSKLPQCFKIFIFFFYKEWRPEMRERNPKKFRIERSFSSWQRNFFRIHIHKLQEKIESQQKNLMPTMVLAVKSTAFRENSSWNGNCESILHLVHCYV